MFIYNLKINKNFIFKIFMIIAIIIACGIVIIGAYNILNSNEYETSKHILDQSGVINITNDNYTNILQSVTNDIDSYIGRKVSYSGYVYRLIDFEDTQFVLARNMVLSSEYEAVVVGFLCDCEIAKNFKDNTWVKVTGTIARGEYHGEIPMLKIIDIKQIDAPEEEYVYPPDNTYIPTSTIF